jgi:hypothetical protein
MPVYKEHPSIEDSKTGKTSVVERENKGPFPSGIMACVRLFCLNARNLRVAGPENKEKTHTHLCANRYMDAINRLYKETKSNK